MKDVDSEMELRDAFRVLDSEGGRWREFQTRQSSSPEDEARGAVTAVSRGG